MSDGPQREFVGNGRFALDRLLGTGGRGSVYLAFDTALGRWVALKRMRGGDSVVPEEARTIAGICHPNIVMVHDIIEEGEEILLVMELVLGPSLGELPEPMGLGAFREFAAQCLEGLAAAHASGVVHRDLKPGNILLAPLDGGGYQAKLLGFGQPRPMEGPSGRTAVLGGPMAESVHTMSPEQLGGEPLDQRTDLYSLGCVFYQALSGGVAFGGETIAAVCAAHFGHCHKPLAEMRPDLPPALAAWVERLFAFDRNDRPPGAAEALAGLEAVFGAPQAGGDIPVVQGLPVARAASPKRVRLIEASPIPIAAPVPAAAAHLPQQLPAVPVAFKPLPTVPVPAVPAAKGPARQRHAAADPPPATNESAIPAGWGMPKGWNWKPIAAAALLGAAGLGAFLAIRTIANAPASSFGVRGTQEKILQAKFYDLKQARGGGPSGPLTDGDFCEAVKQFVGANNWDPSFLSRYYCASAPLFTPRLYVPVDHSSEGPRAFGVEKEVSPFYWLVHYKGKFRALKKGTYRFVGCGDNVLVVRLNGKNVLDGSGNGDFALDRSFNGSPQELLGAACAPGWQLKSGQWFGAEKNQEFDIEIVTGDAGGGSFSSFLFYEEKGAAYPRRPDGSGFAYPLFDLDGSPMPPPAKPSPYNPPVHAAAERAFEGVKP